MRIVSILFKARIINRIKVFKKLLLHRSILCNGLHVHNYKQLSNPMDMITYPIKVGDAVNNVLNNFEHSFSGFQLNLNRSEFSFSLSSSTRKIIRQLRKKELSGLIPILPFLLHKSNNRFYSFYYSKMYEICTSFFFLNICLYNNIVNHITKVLILKFGYRLRCLGLTTKFSIFFNLFVKGWLFSVFCIKFKHNIILKQNNHYFVNTSNLIKLYFLSKF